MVRIVAGLLVCLCVGTGCASFAPCLGGEEYAAQCQAQREAQRQREERCEMSGGTWQWGKGCVHQTSVEADVTVRHR